MSLIRILRTSKVTLTHTFTVDEAATDAAGAVTVSVKRLDGTDAGSGTATHGATGVYTYALTPSVTVDTWTVDWSGSIAGATVVARDIVEIVGDFYFGLAEARSELQIPSTGVHAVTAATIAQKRTEVEQEAERICQVAFVPRFERQKLNGTGTAQLGTRRRFLRAVRAVTVAGVAWASPDVAALTFTDDGTITRPGGALWTAGAGNIIVEYEYGHDYPPEEIRTAAKLRLRSMLGRTSTGVPDRALSFITAEGGTYRVSTPARQKTGIPDVDGVYERYYRPHRAVFA